MRSYAPCFVRVCVTSSLDCITLILLWIPIAFLHWSGREVFRSLPDALTFLSTTGIALSDVVFQAGFVVNVSNEHIPPDC